MDRRKNDRHPIGGTAWFQWKDRHGTRQERSGSLRNVSAGGLFIETVDSPPVGAEVDIEFEFDRPGGRPAASISARGRVNRVEMDLSGDRANGFAAATGRMNLHKLGETAGGE